MTEANDTGRETEGRQSQCCREGDRDREIIRDRKSERKSMRPNVAAWVHPGQVVLGWVGQGNVD